MDKQADLRKWFNEKWVDISRKKKGGGHPECGRDDADDGGGYPKCRPQRAAARMSKKQKAYAVRAKRSKPQGVGGKPTMVATFKKKAMFNPEVNNILESLEKKAELSGRQRAALGSLAGNTASQVIGLPGGGMAGAALGAKKGRRLQSAAGDLVGGVAGSGLGAAAGHALTRGAHPAHQLIGTVAGAHLGNLAGSAAGTYLAHGKDKKTRKKKSAEQVKEAKLSGRQRAALGSLIGNSAGQVTGLPGGGMAGAALGADKGRRLQSAAGDLVGGVAGAGLGAAAGHALTRNSHPGNHFLGTAGGAILGNLAGSAAGTFLAHGKNKKSKRKQPTEQVKKASAEVEAILDDLEAMHKEGMFGMGRNSRRAIRSRARARRRRGLDATRNMRRNATRMGAMARAEDAGKKFTNPTPKFGFRKSNYMKNKDAANNTLLSRAGRALKTPGGAAAAGALAGGALAAAAAKPKTVTTTAPDGTKTTTTQQPSRLKRFAAGAAGGALAAGGARMAMKKFASEANSILSLLEKEAAKKPQVLPKAGWNMVAPVFRGDSKRKERANMIRKAGIGAGIGAAAGAVRGAVKDPGTNADGTKKSRLKAIARNAAGGAALGGAAGAGVSAANDRGYSVTMKPRG